MEGKGREERGTISHNMETNTQQSCKRGIMCDTDDPAMKMNLKLPTKIATSPMVTPFGEVICNLELIFHASITDR